MSESLSTDPYKGVRDFYPNDWRRLAAVFATIRRTLDLWGYEEYNASPLERAELYEEKTSEEIINDQTYTFTDRGNRRVTLRPEMTPTLARMIAARKRELSFPLRWYSLPNVFRYERPQKGRLREHYQVNADLVGISGTEADAEIITLASTILKSFGATDNDFTVRVNSRTLLFAACRSAGLSDETTTSYFHLLDKKKKMPAEDFEMAVQRLTPSDPLAAAETTPDAAVREEKTRLIDFIETLRMRGISNVVYDPTLIRGFDYYTGIIFEVFDTNSENQRSIFGGGRYDNLIGILGKESVPAVGFGLGDVTLTDFLDEHHLVPQSASLSELYVGTPSPENIPSAQTFAKKLRDDGVRVFVNLTERGLGDQIKDAVKRGIPYFVAYGKDEETSGRIRLKNLLTGVEEERAADDIVRRMKT